MIKALIRKIVDWAESGRKVEDDYLMSSGNMASFSSTVNRGRGSRIKSMGGINSNPNSTSGLDMDDGFTFTLYNADGGKVVKTSFYDNQKSIHVQSLHIILANESFEEQIAMIMTKESIRR